MAKDTVTVRLGVRNIKLGDFAKIIASMPERVRPIAIRAAGEYLIVQFKKYPPYRHVTRRAAYGGDGFVSDKQRRFVMASLRAGRNLKTGTPMEPGFPHRTGNMQRGWILEGVDQKLTTIKNVNPAAGYLFADDLQARQLEMVGWKTITEMTAENIDKAAEAALEAAYKFTVERLLK